MHVLPTNDVNDTPSVSIDPQEECTASSRELPTEDEGTFLAQGVDVSATRGKCRQVWHTVAGSEKSRLDVKLIDWGTGSALVRVETLLNELILDWQVLRVGESVSFELAHSGEHIVRFAPFIGVFIKAFTILLPLAS